MYYLVNIDTENEFFKKFRRFFKTKNKKYQPGDYSYAGFVKGNEEEGEDEGKDIYIVSDDEESYPDVEIIDLDEWATRFPTEGNLTCLPEYYLVETDTSSPLWGEFLHFHVDNVDFDSDFCPADCLYVGKTNSGWYGTDDQSDCPECDVLTLEEWKTLRTSIEIY